jgi:hypothetical protein
MAMPCRALMHAHRNLAVVNAKKMREGSVCFVSTGNSRVPESSLIVSWSNQPAVVKTGQKGGGRPMFGHYHLPPPHVSLRHLPKTKHRAASH